MSHIHYNVTTTNINQGEYEGLNGVYHENDASCLPPKPEPIPGYVHINPISTQIDLQSVADQLSDYKFTKGIKITTDMLLNPKPLDYEASPANY